MRSNVVFCAQRSPTGTIEIFCVIADFSFDLGHNFHNTGNCSGVCRASLNNRVRRKSEVQEVITVASSGCVVYYITISCHLRVPCVATTLVLNSDDKRFPPIDRGQGYDGRG